MSVRNLDKLFNPASVALIGASAREGSMTASDIAAEIRQTRSRLSRQLARLDREYPLRYLLARTLRFSRDPGFDLACVRDALRGDIVPLALIGLGLGWLEFRGDGQSGSLLERAMRLIGRLRDLAHPKEAVSARRPS